MLFPAIFTHLASQHEECLDIPSSNDVSIYLNVFASFCCLFQPIFKIT